MPAYQLASRGPSTRRPRRSSRRRLLTVDPAAAAALAGWFQLGEKALKTLAGELAAEKPSKPELWPEHFDLAITAGAVNYGFSPGDETIATPYVYVGPHEPPTSGELWNAPFGAYRTWDDVRDAEAALAFLRSGHEAATESDDFRPAHTVLTGNVRTCRQPDSSDRGGSHARQGVHSPAAEEPRARAGGRTSSGPTRWRTSAPEAWSRSAGTIDGEPFQSSFMALGDGPTSCR